MSSVVHSTLDGLDSHVFIAKGTQASTLQDWPSATILQNDPVGHVRDFYRQNEGKLTSVFTDLETLFQAVGHLQAVSASKIVFHIEVKSDSDYGLLLALRHSGLAILQSFDAVDAQRIAACSYLLAKHNKPVIHIFAPDGPPAPVSQLYTSEKIASIHTSFESCSELGSLLKRALAVYNLTPYSYNGPVNPSVVAVLMSHSTPFFADAMNATDVDLLEKSLGLVKIHAYRPWSNRDLLNILPGSTKTLVLGEQIRQPTTAWSPLVQDLISDNLDNSAKLPAIVAVQLGRITLATVRTAIRALVSNTQIPNPIQKIYIGEPFPQVFQQDEISKPLSSILQLEDAYTKVLNQVFPTRIDIINAFDSPKVGSPFERSPEFGFGAILARQKELSLIKSKLHDILTAADKSSSLSADLRDSLFKWALNPSSIDVTALAESVKGISFLSEYSDTIKRSTKSSWIIGSDAWSYDIGNSGVHHVLASGQNINMLVIDSEPQNSNTAVSRSRKKDLGLYALNFGTVYVASVAVYASYTQLLQALIEADAFQGPSLVVAYLPYRSEHDTALEVLKETKTAVDTGYWPLYRYNPTDSDAFKLDSAFIRQQLRDFLDRENRLTLLSRSSPDIKPEITESLTSSARSAQIQRTQAAVDRLKNQIKGPSVSILFASDGGTAEGLAKKLGTRAGNRGMKAFVRAFDEYSVEELAVDENVVFITSTAGQGEFPQNGRQFWDELKTKAVENKDTLNLPHVKVAIFGLGDSLYWPRKEDAIYYNKPAKDLSAKLADLNVSTLVELGLGDDQAADGFMTAYNEWEPLLWSALGVERSSAEAQEPPPITNEDIKINSDYLRGTIAAGLKDTSTGAISAADQQLTKFHGIYMQDDRDVREARKAIGLEPAYSFMIRVRLPGCVATPEQWLRIDELSRERGNETFKLTTRGTFQLHGVVKSDLKPAIRQMNAALMDTVAACGDVDRNVVASAYPENSRIQREVVEVADQISEHLLPSTTAYHEIWLEGADESDKSKDYNSIFEKREKGPKKSKTLVAGSTLVDLEPLYGPTYLPRKFKINIAIPPHNDVDVYAHDIGLVAILEKTSGNDVSLTGFNVLVGGGMGTTHNNKKTYPRTGSLMGYVSKDKIVQVCEKIMLVQRDHGDRTNRKHARLKYTIDDLGHDVYKSLVEEKLGYKFEAAKPFKFESNIDNFNGWVKDEKGRNHFTVFVENGRVEDNENLQFKTGLREIAEYMKDHGAGEFRLTANQHVLISDIPERDVPGIAQIMSKYKLDNLDFSALRLSSAACVAFPTCGLAMAESERYLPVLISKIESSLEKYGMRHDSVVMRMTGCPNGCARPWLAEVALVGKAYGAYNLLLGGGYHGQRLNKLYKSSIKEDEILATLEPLFKRWALERNDKEHFGDFLIRTGVIAETTEGKNFWDHTEDT